MVVVIKYIFMLMCNVFYQTDSIAAWSLSKESATTHYMESKQDSIVLQPNISIRTNSSSNSLIFLSK